jgi:hypothetical protein
VTVGPKQLGSLLGDYFSLIRRLVVSSYVDFESLGRLGGYSVNGLSGLAKGAIASYGKQYPGVIVTIFTHSLH